MLKTLNVTPLVIAIVAFLSCLTGYYLATPERQLQSVVFVTPTNDTLALDYATPQEVDSLVKAGAEIIVYEQEPIKTEEK